MKLTNANDGKRVGLREKAIGFIANGLEKIAINPRGCQIGVIYEPELPQEIIFEMLDKD